MHAHHKTPTLADAILTLPSSQSQRVLENGLQAFAATTHSSLWRYIKCAANLPAKGVRDVALRVRWMRRARGGGVKKRKGGTAGGGSGEDAKANGGGAVPTKPKGKAKAKAKAPAGRIVTRDASGNESSGMNQTAAHTRVANPSTKPRSVFAMPPPGPPGGGGMGVHANGNGPGGVGGMGVGPGPGTHGVSMVPPLARGVGGHIIGGQMHGGPPGYGAMGGGMGTGVLPGPGYNGPGVPYPTHVPGPYPVHPGFGQVPVGMVPQRALHAGAHVLHVPPQRSPVGALEDHGGVGITLGIGAIDPVLHEKLCANAAIVKKLRDDDLLLENRNDGSGSVSAEKKLTPHARLALLGEMRDLIVDVTDTMRVTQGIMQRMPQLPVTLNTGLANALLPPPVARRNGIDNGKALISKATRPRTDRKKTQPRPKVTQKGPVSGAGVGKGKGKGKQ